MRLPFKGGDPRSRWRPTAPRADFAGLGWAKFRAPANRLHCRLGGTSTRLRHHPGEESGKVIPMVIGKSAAQPPATAGNTYPPGRLLGHG